MHAQSTSESFAAQIEATQSTEEFTVLMKNYIATHFAHLLGSKTLLLNTKDGLDTLAVMVQKKLAERARTAQPARPAPTQMTDMTDETRVAAPIIRLPNLALAPLRRVA